MADPLEEDDVGLPRIAHEPPQFGGERELYLLRQPHRHPGDVGLLEPGRIILRVLLHVGKVEEVPRLLEGGRLADDLGAALGPVLVGQRELIRAVVGLQIAQQRREDRQQPTDPRKRRQGPEQPPPVKYHRPSPSRAAPRISPPPVFYYWIGGCL